MLTNMPGHDKMRKDTGLNLWFKQIHKLLY